MSKETLIDQFTMSHWAAMKAIDGINHDESLRLPKEGGNCMNWVLGHLTATRGEVLKMLGAEPIWQDESLQHYKRGAERLTDAEKAVDFDKITSDFAGSQEPLLAALGAQTDDQLAVHMGFSFVGRDNDTLEQVLAGFAFHESYHVGQIGILRRFLGHPGIIK